MFHGRSLQSASKAKEERLVVFQYSERNTIGKSGASHNRTINPDRKEKGIVITGPHCRHQIRQATVIEHDRKDIPLHYYGKTDDVLFLENISFPAVPVIEFLCIHPFKHRRLWIGFLA